MSHEREVQVQARDAFVPGTILAERYRIVSALGRGGMGEVYRADDLKLGQPVALKFLPAAVADSEGKQEHFLDEVRLARQITHPNICRIFDIGESDGQPFLSMELIDGENLATLLRRIGRLPPDKAVAIALDLCDGLQAIHERGILHRDLKPANLMIDGEGRARITDFGMAGWTGTEARGGTLRYMAPEQLLKLELTACSDLYALGLVLYELFTGQRVFDRPRTAILTRKPTPPSQLVKDLDPNVERVILRCLEREPGDRPQSARAVAAALRHDSEGSWRPVRRLEIPHRPRWVLEKKIGEGGFGDVWLAVHSKTRERRVFKFCFDLRELWTLQREVTLFRLLTDKLGKRDDITRIVDWSFDEPPYFVESEHAADGNLPEWAAARGGLGALPLETRLDVIVKTARALAAAHSVGVLHQDVKPANVLITSATDGALCVRLADFGVGSVTDHRQLTDAGITALGMTEGGGGVGTRLYMAPELLEGRPATVQSDVYALGVVLYQVVVGDFSRVLTSNWQRDVDDELLREDIAAAVDGSPERRLGSAGELARRLVHLAPRRTERRARRLSRRLLRIGTWAISGLLLLTATLGWHTRRVGREQARTKDIARVTLAGEWLGKDPTSAARVLLEVDRPTTTAFAEAKMREVLYEELALFELRLGQPLLSASLSPNGEHVAVLSEEGRAWLWKIAAAAGPVLLAGHDGPVVDVTFGPHGRRVVTASEDGTGRIRRVDATAGAIGKAISLPGRSAALVSASFSPDGRRVVATVKDGTVRVWTLDAGGGPVHGPPLVFRSPNGPARWASFSPDGTRLLFVADDGVEIWDARRTEEPLFVFRHRFRPFISSASFSPDGRHVAVVYGVLQPRSSHPVEIWHLGGSGDSEVLGRHDGPVSSALFSPEGARVLTASEDTTARIWRPDSAEGESPVVLRGHHGRVASAVFSPDGERILTASTDGTARIWSGERARVFKTNEPLISAAFDPPGERVVTVSREGTIRVWDLTRPDIFVALKHEGPVSDASFSPDGERILTSSKDGTVRLWNADGIADPVVLGNLRDVMQVLEASFSTDGTRILAIYEDLTVRTWETDGSGSSLFFESHLAHGVVSGVSFSPGGDRLAATPSNGEIRIWKIGDSEAPLAFAGHRGSIEDVTFSPNGNLVASASWDGTVRVWDTEHEVKSVVFDHGSRVYAVSFNPRGDRLATASADGRVRVWNISTVRTTHVFRHDRLVRAPLFSPNADLVATVSRDGTARVEHVDGMGVSLFLKGHTNSVVNASFSPDGKRIVTTSRDGTARVWNADGTGDAIVLRHGGPVHAAAFSPNGARVVTASEDGSARVWRLLDTDEILASIRSATRVCLDPEFREKTLGDSPAEARRRHEACERSYGRIPRSGETRTEDSRQFGQKVQGDG